ncbi:MAG: ATP-binding protein [Thermoplasmata archaeon]|nr:ATP-binding protein [Thermoplasmata archaeon]
MPTNAKAAPSALVSWSSGKDAAFALQEVRRSRAYDVVGLLTTLTADFRRVSMHGVREELLDRQARALGLPLVKIRIPIPCPNEVYEQEMSRALERAKGTGVRHVIFGDLFLEDVRHYRETRLESIGMTGVFPLWGRETGALAAEMIATGLRARVSSLDPKKLPRAFAGRELDAAFLRALPPGVDPCGERGEFHTFVTHCREFREPVNVELGEVVERDGFVFADLTPR